MTRVSVIIPFLDAEAYLSEAIASVQAQTVPDWEMLLVDDGSADRSLAIAEAAAAADARIRLLRRAAGGRPGVAAARNTGITAARGEFLAFLDADDLFEPHMLATTLAAMERNPSAAMVYGPTRWWHPDGSRRDWIEEADRRGGRLHPPPSLLRSVILLQDGHVPCICSVLVRRSAAEAVGGFEERFRLYEDQTLWVKIFRSFDVYLSPACLARYRQHAGSVSAAASAAGEYDRMAAHPARAAFLAWVEEELRTGAPPPPELARALRLARSPYHPDPGLGDHVDRLAYAAHLFGTHQRRRMMRLLRKLRAIIRRERGAGPRERITSRR